MAGRDPSALYEIYLAFTRHADPFHRTLLAGTAAVIGVSVGLGRSVPGSPSAASSC